MEPYTSSSSWTFNVQLIIIVGPDSLDSYNIWVNVRKAISLTQNRVKLTYQFNPLPYHFYSAKIHQAFFYVLRKAGDVAAEEFISFVFNKQEQYT